MLESADVDEDYFAPLPRTSLATLFTKGNKDETTLVNSSLKYIPVVQPKQETGTSTECLFTCFFMAFEWVESSYISKGKVGCAILKTIKNSQHKILIYDTLKNPLSYTNISPTLQVKVKKLEYIAFYDNMQKYWMLKGGDVEKIMVVLQSLNANILPWPEDVSDMGTEPSQTEIKDQETVTSKVINEENDRNSSNDQQTKASILSRMDVVGQAILPLSLPQTYRNYSSSEETTEYVPKSNKPNKSRTKNSNTPNEIVVTTQGLPSICNVIATSKDVSNSTFTENINTLMAEQRMANSEIRMNLCRLSDKIDLAIQNTPQHRSSSNDQFTMEVYKKLLNEYEIKIKNLEEAQNLPASVQLNTDMQLKTDAVNQDAVLSKLVKEIEKLSSIIQEGQRKLPIIEQEMKTLSLQINELQENSNIQRQYSEELKQSFQNINQNGKHYSQEDLKEIMNEIFNSVCKQLENNVDCSSEKVKKMLGSTIKTTINKLFNAM